MNDNPARTAPKLPKDAGSPAAIAAKEFRVAHGALSKGCQENDEAETFVVFAIRLDSPLPGVGFVETKMSAADAPGVLGWLLRTGRFLKDDEDAEMFYWCPSCKGLVKARRAGGEDGADPQDAAREGAPGS